VPSNIANTPIDTRYDLRAALHDDLLGVAAALTREECVFDSAPLERDMVVAGAPRFKLHLLPNRPAVQIHCELYDVAPDMGKTDHGRLISRGHQGTHVAAAGTHLQFEFDGAAICYRLAAGHRLRLVVSNYNTTFAYPFFQNSCTRLFHEVDRSSSVEIPLRDV
jgi:predicted acyl esterase